MSKNWQITKTKILYSPFLWSRFSVSSLQSHNRESRSPQEYFVIILLTSEERKTASTIEQMSGLNTRLADFESRALTTVELLDIYFERQLSFLLANFNNAII